MQHIKQCLKITCFSSMLRLLSALYKFYFHSFIHKFAEVYNISYWHSTDIVKYSENFIHTFILNQKLQLPEPKSMIFTTDWTSLLPWFNCCTENVVSCNLINLIYKGVTAIFSALDYHTWGAMLETNWHYTPKPTKHQRFRVTQAIWTDLHHVPFHIAILSLVCNALAVEMH